MMRRLFPLMLALPLAACQPDTPKPPAGRIVLVDSVRPAEMQSAVYRGEVRARQEYDLAFRVGGRIVAREVDAGQAVRAGQVLARLDPQDLQLAAEAARAQLQASESDYATALAERDRHASLLARKFISQAAFEARENTLNAARARRDQARAQSGISDHQAAYGSLRSDHPAVVAAVLAEAGQVVAAGQPVLRLARPGQLEIAISVPESRLAEIRAAKAFTASLGIDAGVTVRGELRELAAVADPLTRSYAARIRLIDPPPTVQLGMSASVSTQTTLAAPEMRVPLGAVLHRGDGPFVRLVVDGKVVSRPVELSRFDETGARIRRGLAAGELVVVAGAARLSDGEAVQARPQVPAERQR